MASTRTTGVVMTLLAAAGAAFQPVRAESVAIQSRVAQLFIDDAIVESAPVVRILHQPVKDDGGRVPIIKPAEHTSLLAYGSIVFDEKLRQYVMFVQEFPSRQMYRITSPDGLQWSETDGTRLEKVALDTDLGDVPRDKANNAAGNRGIDLFSCYYDKKDSRYPYKGWCWFANWGNDLEGIFYIQSRDGKTWERGRQVVNGFAGEGDKSCREIHQGGKVVWGPGDVTLFGYDPVSDRYLGIFKFFNHKGILLGNNLRSRAYMFLDRLDEPVDTSKIERIALLPAGAYAGGDTVFDEYYATTAWRYESMWLGGLKVFHPRGSYPHSSAGCAFLKLVCSRDGLNWQKVPYINDDGVPEVFIPNGKEGGNGGRNDGGYMSEFSQGPLRIGDEIVYYYCSSAWGKNQDRGVRIMGGGVFRARLRVDGFVSVDEGVLTTKTLRFSGKDLQINATGPVKVEVLRGGGGEVSGTAESNEVLGVAEIKGDSIRHAVTFEGKSLGQLVPSGEAKLRFTVEPPGKLYSFTVR